LSEERRVPTRESDLLAKNVALLKSTVNKQGLIGLMIALTTILITTLLVGFQTTGEISIDAILYVQEHNVAVRIIDFLPFIFTYWGQMAGHRIATQAGAIIVKETDDLRAETTSWKKKSLHEATHDALTGLPNRALFYERAKQAITAAALRQEPVLMLFMDLDGFKDVNDTFGNVVGDQMLKYLSTRIQRSIAGGDTLARMGGDEFALLLGAAPNHAAGVEVALRVHRLLSKPFKIKDQNVEVSVSIGIAHYPEQARDVDVLIQCAEIAAHAAKRTIKGYVVYTAALKQENPRRLMLTSDLRQAIADERLEMHYQPKVDMRSGAALGAETLLRWHHAEHGRISPEEFTRLAERARLIGPLTRLVIKNAIHQLRSWAAEGIDLQLSVNITAADLNDTDLPDYIGGVLRDAGVNPANLTLEITESSVMENARLALQIINRLSDLKLRLSIDDFGTGYSSLAYLSKLRVNELKIDKSFVYGMLKNPNDHMIVKATIDLGHSLSLRIVAEGIEDMPTWDALRQLGCDVGQGYYLSQPLPVGEFVKWLANHRRQCHN
jgi:diguanylate cyclase (GGDEF)-like protein